MKGSHKIIYVRIFPIFQVFSGPPIALAYIISEAADRPDIKD